MIDVAIISKNQYIQKSLSLLIKADPDLRLIMVTEDFKDIFSNLEFSKETVVLMDIEMKQTEEILKLYSNSYRLILYSGSKEFLDIRSLLEQYKVSFFNVYTNPDCILETIRENVEGA